MTARQKATDDRDAARKASNGEMQPPARRTRTKAAAEGQPGTGTRPSPDGLDKLRLTGDRLMVRMPEDRERTSKAGLLIPATAASTHRRCIWSDVVLIGPETRGVRAGDLVLFIPQSGLEVEVDGDTFLLLRERDVQAVASERVDRHAGQYL